MAPSPIQLAPRSDETAPITSGVLHEGIPIAGSVMSVFISLSAITILSMFLSRLPCSTSSLAKYIFLLTLLDKQLRDLWLSRYGSDFLW
jgi:hypothetical protein